MSTQNPRTSCSDIWMDFLDHPRDRDLFDLAPKPQPKKEDISK